MGCSECIPVKSQNWINLDKNVKEKHDSTMNEVGNHAQIAWLFLIVVQWILWAVASFLNYILSPLLAYRLLFTQHLGLNIKINIFSHLLNLIKQEKVYRKWKSRKTHGVWWRQDCIHNKLKSLKVTKSKMKVESWRLEIEGCRL